MEVTVEKELGDLQSGRQACLEFDPMVRSSGKELPWQKKKCQRVEKS
jgi:hypothetical protein